MNSKTRCLLHYVADTFGLEEELLGVMTTARSYGRNIGVEVKNYLILWETSLLLEEDDISVKDLESNIDWNEVVQILEHHQNLAEMHA